MISWLVEVDLPFNVDPVDDGVDDDEDDEGSEGGDMKDCDGDATGDDGDGEGEGHDRKNIERPETKAELDKLRARFKNTMRLVAHLFHDRSLQVDLRLVGVAAFPFMREYTESLELMKAGQAWFWAKSMNIKQSNRKSYMFSISSIINL